ncbi:MAG: Jag N-terminal domain-containing protein [Deltaproteobacteria bacterium]
MQKALKALKLPRDKVKIEVLSEEEKGLFGMPGAKPAKVRISAIN